MGMTILNGRKTASATAAALATTQEYHQITIKNLDASGGVVCVGDSNVTTSTGYELGAGDSVTLVGDYQNPIDIADVYVIDDGTGYTVSWLGVDPA